MVWTPSDAVRPPVPGKRRENASVIAIARYCCCWEVASSDGQQCLGRARRYCPHPSPNLNLMSIVGCGRVSSVRVYTGPADSGQI